MHPTLLCAGSPGATYLHAPRKQRELTGPAYLGHKLQSAIKLLHLLKMPGMSTESINSSDEVLQACTYQSLGDTSGQQVPVTLMTATHSARLLQRTFANAR